MKYTKLKKKLFSVMVLGGMLTLFIGNVAFAVTKTSTYANMTITYTALITSTKGTGITQGTAAPYMNCALVTVYNDAGIAKGNASAYKGNGFNATAAKLGVFLHKAYTCHSFTDANKRQLEAFNKQKTITVTR